MYSEDLLESPRSGQHFWQMVEDNLGHARYVLSLRIETMDEALHLDSRGKLASLPYRDISIENDQRKHYLKLGRATLKRVDLLVAKRKLTFEFTQEWGKLMFCHGMLAAHLFDDSENLASSRAGKKRARTRSIDAQRLWYARVIQQMTGEGAKPRVTRKAIERAVEGYINAMVERGSEVPGFSPAWFARLMKDGQLVTTHLEKSFTKGPMKEVLKLDLPIPPIPPNPILDAFGRFGRR